MTDTAIAIDPASTAPGQAQDPYDRGVGYMLGRGVKADLGMAAASFLDASDLNDPRGLYAAGMMYLKGVGLTASPDAAMDYLQRAAAVGHAPAKKVLDALSQGKDVSKLPIVIAAEEPVAQRNGDAAPPSSNPVTPGRVLAVVAAVLVLLGGGGGYWVWSSQAQEESIRTAAKAKALADQSVAVQAEQARALADAQARARSATDRADGALREVELEKRRLAEQQADIAAKAEALRQRESEQATRAAPAAAPVVAAAAVPLLSGDAAWDARIKEAAPHLRKMMEAALSNSADTAASEGAVVRALARPARGDRKLARRQNEEGLAANERQDLPRAVASFSAAVSADESDEEIATNLGFALVKAGKATEAQSALARALYLNPSRSSAWYNLGLSYVALKQDEPAYAAFLLTYQFAGSQQKSRDWFEKLALDDTNPPLRKLAQRLLTSPVVKTSTP